MNAHSLSVAAYPPVNENQFADSSAWELNKSSSQVLPQGWGGPKTRNSILFIMDLLCR